MRRKSLDTRLRSLFVLLLISILPNLIFAENTYSLPEIYRSCKLPSHKPIYKLGRSSACGVQSEVKRQDQSCGVATYKTCQAEDNKIVDWLPTGEEFIHGLELIDPKPNEGCEILIPRFERLKIYDGGKDYPDYDIIFENDQMRPPNKNDKLYVTFKNSIKLEIHNEMENEKPGIHGLFNELEPLRIVGIPLIGKGHEKPGIHHPLADFKDEIKVELPNTVRIKDIRKIDHGMHVRSTSCREDWDRKGIEYYSLVPCKEPKHIYVCYLHLQVISPIRELHSNPLCGVESYNTCSDIVYKECRDKSFGVEDYESIPDENCGIDQTSLSALSDQEYFESLISNLNTFITSHDNLMKWNNIRSFLNENNLKNRSISFNILSKVKFILNSLDIRNSMKNQPTDSKQNVFKKYFAFMILDFYSRLVNSYNNQKSREILLLEGLSIDLKNKKSNLPAMINLVKSKILALDFSEEMKKAVLSSLQEVNESDSNKFLSVINDLIKMLKTSLLINRSENEKLIHYFTNIDSIFDYTLVQTFLQSGEYEQAQLKLSDAKFYLKSQIKLSSLPSEDWFFSYLQENAKTKAQNELEIVNRFFNLVNKSNDSLSLIKEELKALDSSKSQIPEPILKLLNELLFTSGNSLSDVKLQILDLLERTIVEPLNSFIDKI